MGQMYTTRCMASIVDDGCHIGIFGGRWTRNVNPGAVVTHEAAVQTDGDIYPMIPYVFQEIPSRPRQAQYQGSYMTPFK